MATLRHVTKAMVNAPGLIDDEREKLDELLTVWQSHLSQNQRRRRYYEQRVKAADVNLGIAVPDNFVGLDITCAWPEKAVKTLANRSLFDGFVFHGPEDESLTRLVEQNNLVAHYRRQLRAQLTHGLTCATVSRGVDGEPSAVVRWHSAETSAVVWDGRRDRVAYGMAIIQNRRVGTWRDAYPTWVNLYTDEAITEIYTEDGETWAVSRKPHPAGRPLIEPFAYNPDELAPFGHARITEPVMDLTDAYLREMLRMEIGAELYTSPQKAVMGASDDAFQMDKFSAYITNMLMIGKDEDGDVPQLMQLAASSMQPHVDVLRALAAAFSGATNTPITELGIIHDNPASAQALYAAEEPLVIEAKNLNSDNGTALKNVAMMMQAVDADVPLSSIGDSQTQFEAHFKSAAMPSVVSQADAMVKIAAADPGFAGTDVFYEQIGFDSATIDRLESEKVKQASANAINAIFGGK